MTTSDVLFGLGPSTSNGPRRFTRTEAAVAAGLAAVLVLVVATFAVVGRPATATRAAAFGGSVVIDDTRGGPVVVDLADGAATLRLTGVAAQVGATSEADVAAVPLANGTLLVNRTTGTVNFVDPDELVVAPSGAGVALPGPPGATAAAVFPDGDHAYVARLAPGATSLSLVSRSTVAQLSRPGRGTSSPPAVLAAGVTVATATTGVLAGGPGQAVAAGGDLWALVRSAGGTVHLVQIVPAGAGRPLAVTDRGAVVGVTATGNAPVPPAPQLSAAPVLAALGSSAAAPLPSASGGAAGGSAAAGSGSGGTGGTAAGAAAPAAAQGGAGTSGARSVALATATSIRLLARAPASQAPVVATVPFAARAVTAIVPVRSDVGGVLFAYRTTAGWFLVGIRTGSGRRIGPVAVTGPRSTGFAGAIGAGAGATRTTRTGAGAAGTVAGPARGTAAVGAHSAPVDLVDPVVADGAIYTLVAAVGGTEASPAAAPATTTRPTMVRIDPSTGRASVLAVGADTSGAYPLVGPAEQPDWAHEEIIADGPRVVIDDPDAELAVVVHTNQADVATTIDKGSAVDINPSAPAGDQVLPGGGPGGTPGSGSGGAASHRVPKTTAASQLVDAALACRTSQQKPNVPQVAQPQAATHAVLLSWTYPLIDPEDCAPSSYTVTATGVGGVPDPVPPTVEVTGQTSLEFTGLRSSSTYQFVVTAYIGHNSTSAPPVAATTNAEGPNAAASVTARGDGSTGWHVQWTPCQHQCVSTEPAATWTVTAFACSGSYLGTAPTLQVPASQDQVTVPFTASPGSLGASLRFTVQPVGANGLLGDPTSTPSCSQGWRAPDATAIHLDAAEPPPNGPTASATLTVTPPPGIADVTVYGSDTTDFVFAVGGVAQPPTTQASAVFPGLQPGTSYATQVTVYPAGHPQAAVVIAGPPVAPTVPWPGDLSVSTSTTVQSFVSGQLTATVHDAFGGVPPGTPMGLAAAGSIVCDNEETQVPALAVQRGPGTDGTVTIGLSAASGDFGGACTLALSLTEPATNVHGGPSPTLQTPFTVPDRGVISATWDPAPSFPYSASPQVAVTATGNAGAVTGWTATVVSPSGCTVSATSPRPDGTVRLDLGSCQAAVLTAMRNAGQTQMPFDAVVEVAWSGLAALGPQFETLQLPAVTLVEPGSTATAAPSPGSSGSGSSGSGSSGSGSSSPGSSGSGSSSTGSSSTGSSGSGSSGSGSSSTGSSGSGSSGSGSSGSGSSSTGSSSTGSSSTGSSSTGSSGSGSSGTGSSSTGSSSTGSSSTGTHHHVDWWLSASAVP